MRRVRWRIRIVCWKWGIRLEQCLSSCRSCLPILNRHIAQSLIEFDRLVRARPFFVRRGSSSQPEEQIQLFRDLLEKN